MAARGDVEVQRGPMRALKIGCPETLVSGVFLSVVSCHTTRKCPAGGIGHGFFLAGSSTRSALCIPSQSHLSVTAPPWGEPWNGVLLIVDAAFGFTSQTRRSRASSPQGEPWDSVTWKCCEMTMALPCPLSHAAGVTALPEGEPRKFLLKVRCKSGHPLSVTLRVPPPPWGEAWNGATKKCGGNGENGLIDRKMPLFR